MVKITYTRTIAEQIERLNELLQKQGESLKTQNLVFCEDRFTLTLEEEVLSASEKRGSFSTSVFSFSRYASHLQRNLPRKKTLSKAGGIMAISKILYNDTEEKRLRYLKQNKLFSPLAASVYELIAQLKSSKITADDLVLSDLTGALSGKTADVAQIYRNYERFKSGAYLDAQDKIDLLDKLIVESGDLKGANVFVVGFASFTKQFVDLLCTLARYAQNFTLFLYSFSNPACDFQTISAVKSAFDLYNVKYAEETVKAPIDKEKRSILEGLFSFNSPPRVETDKLSVFSLRSFSDELEHCLQTITEKVRYENYCFSDFTVMLPSLADNLGEIAERFKAYDVPFFADEKQTLSTHPLARYVLSVLKLTNDEFDREDVIDFIENPLFDKYKDEAADFENYLIKAGAKSKNFSSDRIFRDEKMREIRDGILSYRLPVGKIASVKVYADAVTGLCESLRDRVEALAERYDALCEREFSSLSRQAVDRFISLLVELTEILGTKTVLLDEFTRVLCSGVAATELSNAPLYADSVFVGDFTASKILNRRCVFALSVNEGLVPFVKNDVAIITDRDIDQLKTHGIDLEPKIDTVNRREKLNVLLALCSFTEELRLSFSSLSLSGDEYTPSEIISTFSELFTKNGQPLEPLEVKEPTSAKAYVSAFAPTLALAKRLYARACGRAKDKDKFAEALTETARKALREEGRLDEISNIDSSILCRHVEGAFDKSQLYSISMIEEYFRCPYLNFVENALRAKQREEGALQSFDVGNYIHSALEFYQKSPHPTNDGELDKTVGNCLLQTKLSEPYNRLLEIPRFNAMIARLDREAFAVIKNVYLQSKKCEYSPLGAEIKFGYTGSDYPPVTLGNGAKMRGKVDFADRFERYVRVIDYKTGHVDDSLNALYNGQKIQPFLYLDALCGADLIPAGALYFPIHDVFGDETDTPYRMKGFIAKDLYAASKMDSDLLAFGKSASVPAKVTKSGDFDTRCNGLLSKEQFAACISYAKRVAEKAIDEITDGNVEPSPFDETCKYCKVRGMCGFDKDTSPCRDKGDKITADTISEVLKNEGN